MRKLAVNTMLGSHNFLDATTHNTHNKTMKNIIEQSVTDKFYDATNDRWQYSLQEVESAIEPFCEVVHGVGGKSISFTDVLPTDLDETPSGRHLDIGVDELSYATSYLIPTEVTKHIWMEYTDKAKLQDVQSQTTHAVYNLGRGLQRKKDDVLSGIATDKDADSPTYQLPIIDKTSNLYKNGGIFGVARRGLTSETSDKFMLPDSPTISSDTGGATAGEPCGLNIAKIMEAKLCIEEQNVLNGNLGGKVEIIMLVTPEMAMQLIRDEDRLGSNEYGFSALKTGDVAEIFGVRFVKTNKLPFILDGTKYVRRAVMYAHSRLLFGIFDNFNIEIKDQPGKRKSFTVGGYGSFGAVRKDDKTFITVDCLTTKLKA